MPKVTVLTSKNICKRGNPETAYRIVAETLNAVNSLPATRPADAEIQAGIRALEDESFRAKISFCLRKGISEGSVVQVGPKTFKLVGDEGRRC